MSDPTGRIDAVAERRAKERRASERRKPSTCTALVVAPAPPSPAPETSEPIAEAAFTAQVLGQTGQKRGLKGGTPVLEQARSAYLGAAYSGAADRRPAPGRVTKTEF